VTSQLAQISTVRGIEGMNKTMTQMLAATAQNSAVSSVPMLGKQVLVAGDAFAFQPATNGAATRLGYELKLPATAARLEIVNSSGSVVTHGR
jgi:flagellar basal-body rod modification protein FlgD